MIAILGVFAAVVFGGGLYLFRSMGRMQPLSPQERLRHNHSSGQVRPRTTGLN